MYKSKLIALAALVFLLAGCCNKQKADENRVTTTSSEIEQLFPKGEKIESPNFTGIAYLNNLVMPDNQNQNAVGCVTFEPGARTNWHSHPAGQIIIAIDGLGYYQEKGKPIEIVRKGDVVKCAHNTPHWHGASPDSEFVQIAITGRENGPTVWFEPVTDQEYNDH